MPQSPQPMLRSDPRELQKVLLGLADLIGEHADIEVHITSRGRSPGSSM